MKKISGISSFFLFILLAAFPSGAKSDTIDAGTVTGSTYQNIYFGMTITIPKDWQVQSKENSKALMSEGASAIAGDDQNLKTSIDLSAQRTVSLLTVFKYPIGSDHDFNCSFAIVAEKLPIFYSNIDGKSYLNSMKKAMKMGQFKMDFVGDPVPVTVGGKNFYMQVANIKMGKMIIRQNYYSLISKGYSLGIVTSWLKDTEKKQLDKVIRNIQFKS